MPAAQQAPFQALPLGGGMEGPTVEGGLWEAGTVWKEDPRRSQLPGDTCSKEAANGQGAGVLCDQGCRPCVWDETLSTGGLDPNFSLTMGISPPPTRYIVEGPGFS